MKNKIVKIIPFIFIFLMILTLKSFATFSSTDPTVNSGENISITVKSSTPVENYDIKLESHDGLTYTGCSTSNAGAAVNSSNGVISFASTSSVTTLGTFTFKAPSVTSTTQYKVTFDIDDGTKNTSTVTVKAPANTSSEGGSTTGGSTTTEEKPATKEPKFTDVSKTVYATGDINLRSSWSTSSSATQIKKDTELRLTGTSTETINGYVWYRVTYNGQIKYVAKNLITETKPEERENKANLNLKNLSIEGAELTPAFSNEIDAYSVTLKGFEGTELKVIAEPEDEKTTVKIEGNTEIKPEENTIKITITAEDGTSKVITIIVMNQKTEAFGLQSLRIKNIKLNDFAADKYEYSISFNDLNELEIEAIANEEGATVEIIGNENLKDGDNIITIIVTSKDGEKVATYQIKAKKLTTIKPAENKILNIPNIVLCSSIALFLILSIGMLIARYVQNNRYDEYEDEDDYDYNDEYKNRYDDKDEKDLEKNEDSRFKELYETEEIHKENDGNTENRKEIKENDDIDNRNRKPTVDDLFAKYDENDDYELRRKRSKGKHSK